MPKQRVHYVQVRVTFDKPVTRTEAAREFADCVHGEFYPGFRSDAGLMTVRGVKPAPLKPNSTAKPITRNHK